jgi:hypothetical protein
MIEGMRRVKKEKETTDKKTKAPAKKSALTKVLDAIWNEKEWDKLTNIDKQGASFMLNRFMSIQFPIHAALINRTGVHSPDIVNFWKHILTKQYRSKPNWMFTKVNKNFNVNLGLNINSIDAGTLTKYYSFYKCGSIDLLDQYDDDPEMVLERFKIIETSES